MARFDAEHRAKLSAAAKRRHAEGRNSNLLTTAPTGRPANPAWQGDAVGYDNLHLWMRKTYPKTGTCDCCGREAKTDWANISGQYRRDRTDFAEMCRSCHTTWDGKVNNIKKMRGRVPPAPARRLHRP